MIIIQALSWLWAFGIIGGAMWLVAWLWVEEGPWFAVISGAILFPLAALFAATPFGLMHDSESPTLATLKKGEWVCSASHKQVVTSSVLVGKVVVPQTRVRTICDEYRRAA